jgi:hypothetical protein
MPPSVPAARLRDDNSRPTCQAKGQVTAVWCREDADGALQVLGVHIEITSIFTILQIFKSSHGLSAQHAQAGSTHETSWCTTMQSDEC